MKIIFITRESYNLAGARKRCYNFARELKKYGIETEILSFADMLGAKYGKEESQLRLMDKLRFNCVALKRLNKNKQVILFMQRFNYHSFAPYLACIFNGNRMILDLDDWEMRENPKYYLGFYPSSKAHYFTRSIAAKSVFCIAASRFLQEFLLEFNPNVYYIPSGVDTELFKPSLNNLRQDKIIFSWIGTFNKEEYVENIEFALDCFGVLRKKYNYIYFDIVGDGVYRNKLMKIIHQFSDSNIRLKEWMAPDRIPEYLDTIHIGMLPTVSSNKFNKAKSPTKLFEYMSMARPVISTKVGESIDIIQDGINGFLAQTKEEFIKKMQKLIDDPFLRRQMGENARELIERKYSLRVLGKQLYNALKQTGC
jgi:glycosyltransferase involved in cell wall biosynthesis